MQTPDMVRKEIVMHLIAYNCIRYLMVEAAQQAGEQVRRISFKGSVRRFGSGNRILIRPKSAIKSSAV